MRATKQPVLSPASSMADLITEASRLAQVHGMPYGWLLFCHNESDSVHSASRAGRSGTYWTASHGARPPIWRWQYLRCGLRASVSAHDVDELCAETWHQEWLYAAWGVLATAARYGVRVHL